MATLTQEEFARFNQRVRKVVTALERKEVTVDDVCVKIADIFMETKFQ